MKSESLPRQPIILQELRGMCIELCGSCGGDTIALASIFHQTLSMELDELNFRCLKYNIEHLGLESVVTPLNTNSLSRLMDFAKNPKDSFIGNWIAAHQQGPMNAGSRGEDSKQNGVDMVLIDPPWSNEEFNLQSESECMTISQLATACLKLFKCVVILKLPPGLQRLEML